MPIMSLLTRLVWRKIQSKSSTLRRNLSSSTATNTQYDNAFEIMATKIRYGNGITSEVGMDLSNMGLKNVCLVTDQKLVNMNSVKVARESLEKSKVSYEIFSDVTVEPTDKSILKAISFCNSRNFDGFVAIGGGSVMDTCKAANLYSTNPDASLMDYVSLPIGKGIPVTHTLKPLIAIPTTAGTGSETTGQSIFDVVDEGYKVGISSRAIRPILALVDPMHTLTLPPRIVAYPGLDTLCHALESYTARPFNKRPKPDNPSLRPLYQGCNPISDMWSRHALTMCAKYLKRAVENNDDIEARSAMLLASSCAGFGFGNAGVHLCHAISYPISGLSKGYTSPDYDPSHPLIPHGLTVVIAAPAIFRFTAPACPQKHLEAAEYLGADTSKIRSEDAGEFLSDVLLKYMHDLDVPNGISAFGYSADDVPAIAKGAFVQKRVTSLSPREASEEDLQQIAQESLTVY